MLSRRQFAGWALAYTCASAEAFGKPNAATKPAVTLIEVKELNCRRCDRKLIELLHQLPGVQSVRTNRQSATAQVIAKPGKSLSPLQLWEAVEDASLRPVRLATPTRIYKARPRR